VSSQGRSFAKTKIITNLTETEKVADIVLYDFSTECSSGESYEIGFPKCADMKLLRENYTPLEAFSLIVILTMGPQT